MEAFLRGEISFPGIAEVVEETLNRMGSRPMDSVSEVLEIDRQSRLVAQSVIRGRMKSVAAAGTSKSGGG